MHYRGDEDEDLDLRACSCCKGEYPPNTDYFRPDTAFQDGLNPRCRLCSPARKLKYASRKPQAPPLPDGLWEQLEALLRKNDTP